MASCAVLTLLVQATTEVIPAILLEAPPDV